MWNAIIGFGFWEGLYLAESELVYQAEHVAPISNKFYIGEAPSASNMESSIMLPTYHKKYTW
jgi:hypothetical protein